MADSRPQRRERDRGRFRPLPRMAASLVVGELYKTQSLSHHFCRLRPFRRKKMWCRERGELVPLPFLDFLVKDKEEVSADTAKGWENHYGDNFWQYRKAWFKKPLACLQSPYKKTVWLDLDCEVLGPIEDLFTACEHPSGIAIAKDRISDASLATIYNSGVISFQRNARLLTEWAEQSLENNGSFRGDQDLLSQIILDRGMPVCELPARYNWNIGYGLNPEAIICHWIGDMGKNALRDQLILKELRHT